MSDWISKSKEVWLTWWLVLAWFFLFTFSALGTATITALYGMRWKEMDSQDRFIVCVLIFVNWGTVMMAFLNKAVSRVQRGELPIAEGDELTGRKTVVSSTQTQVVTTSPPAT